MQYPEPDDGAWPARVLRNRRMNQVPETENPATPLRFMHQRPVATGSVEATPAGPGQSRSSKRVITDQNTRFRLVLLSP